MFVLLAGIGALVPDRALAAMAGALTGGTGETRRWTAPGGVAAIASRAADFVPENQFDAQPIVGDQGAFVAQVRLDNRADLLDELGLDPGVDIADSSILELAYRCWGPDCLDHIVGDYAFAVWHRDGSVFAAVDPIGTRRLVWTRIGGGLAMSAQLPALLAHPAASRTPDLAWIGAMLDIGLDRRSTPFVGITALPGGHRLIWRGGEVRVARWWRPATQATVRHRDPRAYVDEVRSLLTQAVSAQLRSASPLSTTLSGGLDSGSVTALAATLLTPATQRIAAYTAVPEPGMTLSRRPNWDPDDSAYAAQVAARYPRLDHHLVFPGGRCALDAAQRVHARSMTPVKSMTNLLWMEAIAARMGSAGSRVLLVGQHGNFGYSYGGNGGIWELAMLGRPGAAFVQAKREAAARGAGISRVVAGAVRGGLRAQWQRGRVIEVPSRRFVNPPYRPPLGERGDGYASPPGSRAFWAAFATVPRHGWSADPVGQWGIEWRDPTADRRLIERLLCYPRAAFRAEGRDRGLARAVGATLLPDAVRLRRTQGAQVPEAPGLIAAHAARYRDALETMRHDAGCRELFDLAALNAALDRVVGGAPDLSLALAIDRACGAGLFLAGLA